MFRIEDDVIYLTRGDDASIEVDLRTGDGEYEMEFGDTLTLTVRNTTGDEGELIFRVESDTNTIVITHADTKEASVGQYSADIQLTTVDGHVFTVFPSNMETGQLKSDKNWKNFWLTPEVTL